MNGILSRLAGAVSGASGAPKLLAGTGKEDVHLIVVFTADRGLCGGFNSSIIRATRQKTLALQSEGKTVKLLFVGRKGHEALKREFADLVAGSHQGIATKKGIEFTSAQRVGDKILELFAKGEFDVCSLYYNKFVSAISQIPTYAQLVPFPVPEVAANAQEDAARAAYEYEPSEEGILADLLPRNVAVQVFVAMLESAASEQGARMSAMDNATRNAGDMIDGLSLVYNRTRQAQITKELIEIISGAEAG